MNNILPLKDRLETEPPIAVEEWGWKYHHLGVPTNAVMPDEKYLPQFKFFVSGFESSPFGVEWMRFEDDCPVHQIIQTVPHLAFEVKDLAFELENKGFNVIAEPNSPCEGIIVAMIEHNGTPIELMEFEN